MSQKTNVKLPYRVGFGYDIHQLAENLPLFLGGIQIEHYKGCIAHSDGDVVIHALCDALLGAIAARDIGFHFPDNDDTYKNIDSKILLAKVLELVEVAGYGIGNVDISILMQKPRLQNHIPKMQEVLAQILKIDTTQINIKATTTEKLGPVGEEKAVEVYAVVMVG